MATSEYSPLELGELANSVVNALLRQDCEPLPPPAEFKGSGLYAIYYCGEFETYRTIALANLERPCSCPIYVGKAVPSGARKGWPEGEPHPTGPFLFHRLKEHAESIEQVRNLRLRDFSCKYLVANPVWIPLGERLLIQRFRPVWNIALDGFGNHDPGIGRKDQQRSPWDEVHRGRYWAEKLAPNRQTAAELAQQLQAQLEATSGHSES